MLLPFFLLLGSAATHLAFFGWPQQVVFDEVYFARFVGDYSTGSYYFDIHPPLAKLISKFFGDVVGTTYGVDVSTIGNTLPWDILLLRLVPIGAGILLPVVIYFICRYLNFSRLTAFAAGAFIILENSILVQSRFLLLDSMLLLFGFAAILFYLMYVRKGKGWGLLALSAVLAAGAFSIKWTGFSYVLLIVIAEIIRTKRLQHMAKFVALYAVIGLTLYMSVFAIHFKLLPNSGPGDAFMTDRFQSTLDGSQYYGNPDIKPKQFFGKFIELNYQMFEANRTLTATHPYSSPWFTWPFMLRGVFYWQGKAAVVENAFIYLLGNPLIYLVGTCSIIFLFWKILIKKYQSSRMNFIVAGFLVNFLPFAFIGRVMFLYHYEAALVFSILAFCYILEKFIPREKKEKVTFITLGLCLLVFVYFSPLTYGLDLTDTALQARMWLPTWR